MGSQIVFLLAVATLPLLAYSSSCAKECIASSNYFSKNCPDGKEMGQDCDPDEDFCSTPYSRCQNGKCSCLPDFKLRNMTMGAPAICIPETPESNLDSGRDPTADICRYNRAVSNDESGFTDQIREMTPFSEEYEQAVYGRILSEEKARKKRQAAFILPPTVVNECRKSQQCFQIASSAYGVCKVPKCRVGTPDKNSDGCDAAANSGCPSGYSCAETRGQIFNRDTGAHSMDSHCCPVICANGYYKYGRCWRNVECMKVQEDCEDRCAYEPCRFMVDPCMNFGTCLVPRVAPGARPSHFWCKCTMGFTGRVCEEETDGTNFLNRPTADKLILCEGSLCEPPPPRAVAIQTAPVLPGIAAQYRPISPLAPAAHGIVRPCRMDTHKETCERLAQEGACTKNREYMIQNCDCACTRLLSRNKAVRYYPIPYTAAQRRAQRNKNRRRKNRKNRN